MIDDDIKFFRENFSASSLSDFTETPKKQPLYQTKNNRLNVPQPKKYLREVHYHREEERSIPKPDIPKPQNKNAKVLQYKMLNKLKSQHQQIRHLHANSQQQSVWMEESDRASQPGRNRFRAQKSKRKDSEEDRRQRNPLTQILDREDKKLPPLMKKQSDQFLFQNRTKQLETRIQEKQRYIKKIKNSEQQVIEQYKSQIVHLKEQIDKLVEENAGLKKSLITKELQNQQLKEELRRKQNDPKYINMEKELHLSRTREMEYLSTIKNLQEKEGVEPINVPNIEMATEINQLKQALQQNNEVWEKRLKEAVETERKISLQAAEKILVGHIPPTPMSQVRQSNQENFEQYSERQQDQFIRFQEPGRIYSKNFPNIRVSSPKYSQKMTRGQRAIEMLVEELQHMRRPYNPVEQQLKNIKDSMRALMRRTEFKQYKDLAVTTDSLHMVSELQNLKMYIIKEQNARKNYSQQVTFYKSQHTALFQQNRNLKAQVTTLQESLQTASAQLQGLRITVVDQRSRLEQKSRYVEELANSLASIQTHQMDNYTKIKTNVDKQRNHQLQMQVQRLRALLQTEVIQLNKTHDDKVRGLQTQIQTQDRKIKDQEEAIRIATQQLRKCQGQLNALGQKSSKDISILRQANQRLQQQGLSYKTQLSAFSTNNHHLQIQVKERSHAIDHLWMVKQAEFDNVMGQLARMRQGFI